VQCTEEDAAGLVSANDVLLPPGNYRASLTYHSYASDFAPGRWSIYTVPGKEKLGACDFTAADSDAIVLKPGPLKFTLRKWSRVEFRIEYGGRGQLTLCQILLDCVPGAGEWSVCYSSDPDNVK
jgi:hypothetical protein